VPRTGRPAARQVGTVQRAVTVLDALADAGIPLGTNEIARRVGVNASSVSRMLSTFVEAGLLDYLTPTGQYRLGLRLMQLGTIARESLDIRGLARPHLESLTESTGETATLSVPGTHEMMTLDFVQSAQSVRSVAEVGRPSVAHATAVGKVFLAHGGSLPRGPLTRYTEHTITDRVQLRAELERTRDRGWGQAIREREDDLNGVAVPVLEPSGGLVAVLGVQGPAERFGVRAIRAAVEPMLAGAAALSAAL